MERKRFTRAQSLFLNTLLIIISIFFALLLIEIYMRLFTDQETKRYLIYDKELGWRGKPLGEGVYIRNADNVRSPYQYNELGFRDEPISSLNPFSKKIILLGDSFVESLEVEYHKTFHKIIENNLQQRSGSGIDVINISSQGYSTAQEILALRKYKHLINPDLVLLVFFTGNDYNDNIRKQFAYLDEEENLHFKENEDSWIRVKYLSAKRWFYENSHLVFFIKNFLESRTNLTLGGDGREIDDVSGDYKYRITAELIKAARDEGEKEGAEFGVVIIPHRDEIKEVNRFPADFAAVVCIENNIRHLNMFDLLKKEHHLEHDFHFNEEGHEAAAAAMLKFLENEFNILNHFVIR